MPITPAYAAILGLVFVALSFRTLLLRRKFQVAIGPGGNAALERASRVHSNFAEYVPLTLVLIYFLEIYTETVVWVHVLCIALIIGRAVHAYGVSQVNENYRFRVVGMVLTLSVLISSSTRLLFTYIS